MQNSEGSEFCISFCVFSNRKICFRFELAISFPLFNHSRMLQKIFTFVTLSDFEFCIFMAHCFRK